MKEAGASKYKIQGWRRYAVARSCHFCKTLLSTVRLCCSGKIQQLLTGSYKVDEGLGLSWVILDIHTYTDLYCITVVWSMRTEYVTWFPMVQVCSRPYYLGLCEYTLWCLHGDEIASWHISVNVSLS